MARARSTPVRTAMTGKAAPSARLLREPAAPASLAETLTEQAYRLIEEQIVTLRLKPGDILSEQMLSASCGIGRTPIREALQRLARGSGSQEKVW